MQDAQPAEPSCARAHADDDFDVPAKRVQEP
jgi:hypothetical protein